VEEAAASSIEQVVIVAVAVNELEGSFRSQLRAWYRLKASGKTALLGRGHTTTMVEVVFIAPTGTA